MRVAIDTSEIEEVLLPDLQWHVVAGKSFTQGDEIFFEGVLGAPGFEFKEADTNTWYYGLLSNVLAVKAKRQND